MKFSLATLLSLLSSFSAKSLSINRFMGESKYESKMNKTRILSSGAEELWKYSTTNSTVSTHIHTCPSCAKNDFALNINHLEKLLKVWHAACTTIIRDNNQIN